MECVIEKKCLQIHTGITDTVNHISPCRVHVYICSYTTNFELSDVFRG